MDREADLLAGVPAVSPLAWLCGYHFPVHRIGPDFRPEAADEQPTWLVVYRRLDDRIGFLELNAATARLFELARDNAGGRTGRDGIHGATFSSAELTSESENLSGGAVQIGNAITELLGVVVKRVPDAEAYEKAEPALIEQLLEVRERLIRADLGDGIETPYWPA